MVPVRAECCEPEHLFQEAEHLWAAERDVEDISGISESWGKVCVLKNPQLDDQNRILKAWRARIEKLGKDYTAVPTAEGEDPVLDSVTGLALFDWPKDVVTNEQLPGFDLLLMTANKPTLNAARQYPTTGEIAAAWRDDAGDNVHYFYDNRHYGITTFEDAKIHGLLRGDKEP